MHRKKLRTRKDIESENAELRGAVAELRRQIDELRARPQVDMEAILKAIRELPQAPQIPTYPQPWYPQPWYPQPQTWDIYYGTITTDEVVIRNANNACAALPTHTFVWDLPQRSSS